MFIMKCLFNCILIVLVSFSSVFCFGQKKKIKVACIGSSITYGFGIVNREKNSYPAQLQVYLGEAYDVRNFGSKDAIVIHKGDNPYIRTEEYKQAIQYCPDLIFIEFGTNDSKSQNICYHQDFKSNYVELIRDFSKLSSKPQIVLLSPLRCFLSATATVKDSVIRSDIVPNIVEIANEEKVEYVDLYDLMGSEYQESLMPDSIHCSSIGAGRIAQKLYMHLKPEHYDYNPCVHPICGNEYRNGAGWVKGADWHTVSEEISQIVSSKKLDILFLGNSITQGFGGSRQLVAYKPGKLAVDSCFTNLQWESAGISGDRTEMLLWRILHGNYEKSDPSYVIITIGVNNLVAGHQVQDIAFGIWKVAITSRQQFPNSKILLFGLLPVGLEKHSERRQQYDDIHAILKQQDWGDIMYIDPTSWFTDRNGHLQEDLYKGDYLHLTSKGYQVWCRHIKEVLFNK